MNELIPYHDARAQAWRLQATRYDRGSEYIGYFVTFPILGFPLLFTLYCVITFVLLLCGVDVGVGHEVDFTDSGVGCIDDCLDSEGE